MSEREYCSSGCPRPEDPHVPRWMTWFWYAWDFATWPLTAWRLKREGFRRTGWMTWETRPGSWSDDDGWGEESPACYRAALGFMVHGPGCTCEEGLWLT